MRRLNIPSARPDLFKHRVSLLLIDVIAAAKANNSTQLFELRDENVDDLLRILRPYCNGKNNPFIVFVDYLQIIPSSNNVKLPIRLALTIFLISLSLFSATLILPSLLSALLIASTIIIRSLLNPSKNPATLSTLPTLFGRCKCMLPIPLRTARLSLPLVKNLSTPN